MKMPWFEIFNPTYSLINWWFDRKLGQWLCPVCMEPLLTGGKKQFETLDEHVSDPNKEEYPERPVKVCVNPECKVQHGDYFFADMGSIYGGSDFFNSGIPYNAYGSWDWVHEKKSKFEKTWIHKVLLYKASRLFCLAGLHMPHKRKADDSMFCGSCYKELEHPIYRKHPLYDDGSVEMMDVPVWRRYINF